MNEFNILRINIKLKNELFLKSEIDFFFYFILF
jgi:hypothetical protein